jgi:hypothetical protein
VRSIGVRLFARLAGPRRDRHRVIASVRHVGCRQLTAADACHQTLEDRGLRAASPAYSGSSTGYSRRMPCWPLPRRKSDQRGQLHAGHDLRAPAPGLNVCNHSRTTITTAAQSRRRDDCTHSCARQPSTARLPLLPYLPQRLHLVVGVLDGARHMIGPALGGLRALLPVFGPVVDRGQLIADRMVEQQLSNKPVDAKLA